MFRGEAEPDQSDVGILARGHLGNLADVDFASDDFMPKPDHNLGKEFQSVATLIRDQDAQPLRQVLARHVPPKVQLQVLGSLWNAWYCLWPVSEAPERSTVSPAQLERRTACPTDPC